MLQKKEKGGKTKVDKTKVDKVKVQKKPAKAIVDVTILAALKDEIQKVTKCTTDCTYATRNQFTSQAYHKIRTIAKNNGYGMDETKKFASFALKASGASWDKMFK